MAQRIVTKDVAIKTISSPASSADRISSDVKDAVLSILLEADGYTGNAYFGHLTTAIANHFNVDGVYVCELALDCEKAYPVASHVHQDMPTIDFFAQGGAGDAVIERGDVVHTDAVQRYFPDDRQLRVLGAEAYAGTVLRAESLDPLGLLFIVHRDRLPDASQIGDVLHQLAPRVAAEIERRQHELAYRRSEARLRFLTDRSKDVLFYYQIAPSVELQYISPAVEDVFGLPGEAFHANPALVLEMLESENHGNIEQVLASGSEEAAVVKIRLADGRTRWLEYQDFAVRDHKEELTGIGGNIRDVTRRVEAEESLRNSERYLRALLESIPDTLILLRADGQVIDYIPGEVNTGLPSLEQMRGRNLKTLMSAAMIGVLERTIRAAARSHRVQHVEFEVPGEHPGLCDARCLPFGDGALLLILRDVKARQWHEGDERPHLREVVNNEDHIEPTTRANPYGLTHRELAVLQLVVEGMADKQIADALGISIYTVNKHVGNILGKMNAVSRTEAGVRAIKEGLLTPELRGVKQEEIRFPRRHAA